jgi:hypothetical protein
MMFIYFGELLYGYIAFEMVDQPGIVAIIWIYMLFAAGGEIKTPALAGVGHQRNEITACYSSSSSRSGTISIST